MLKIENILKIYYLNEKNYPLNILRTKLNFETFEKQDKFYSFNSMIERFVSYSKNN